MKIVYQRVKRASVAIEGRVHASIGGGAVLLLAARVRKGRRPSFDRAAEPREAERLYERFCRELSEAGVPVKTGVFAAMMDVELVNSGPVTFIIERGGDD